jgi:hypothetical protein
VATEWCTVAASAFIDDRLRSAMVAVPSVLQAKPSSVPASRQRNWSVSISMCAAMSTSGPILCDRSRRRQLCDMKMQEMATARSTYVRCTPTNVFVNGASSPMTPKEANTPPINSRLEHIHTSNRRSSVQALERE